LVGGGNKHCWKTATLYQGKQGWYCTLQHSNNVFQINCTTSVFSHFVYLTGHNNQVLQMQICLFTYALFNDALGSSDYIASNGRMNSKFEIIYGRKQL
jgi:hypothetical protein